MKLGCRDVFEILKTVHELGFRQFRLEDGDVVLEVSTRESALENRNEQRAAEPAAIALRKPAALPAAPATESVPQREETRDLKTRAGLVAVAAPMAGTFYRAPSPGAPHFVEVGSRVASSDIVCIVEVMKLFNSIRAGCNGVIAEIAAANEEMVAPGQPVMWIRPD